MTAPLAVKSRAWRWQLVSDGVGRAACRTKDCWPATLVARCGALEVKALRGRWMLNKSLVCLTHSTQLTHGPFGWLSLKCGKICRCCWDGRGLHRDSAARAGTEYQAAQQSARHKLRGWCLHVAHAPVGTPGGTTPRGTGRQVRKCLTPTRRWHTRAFLDTASITQATRTQMWG